MLDAERRAEEVDLEHRADVGGVEVHDQAGDLHARVVDDDVEAAQVVDGGGDRVLPAGVVGDVEVDVGVRLAHRLSDLCAGRLGCRR